jgi:hypothetical protein
MSADEVTSDETPVNETQRTADAIMFANQLRPHARDELDAQLTGMTLASIKYDVEQVFGVEIAGPDLFEATLEANHNLVTGSEPEDLTHINLLFDVIYNVRTETGEKIQSPRELVSNPKVPKGRRDAAISIMQNALSQQGQNVPTESSALVDAYLKLASAK